MAPRVLRHHSGSPEVKALGAPLESQQGANAEEGEREERGEKATINEAGQASTQAQLFVAHSSMAHAGAFVKRFGEDHKNASCPIQKAALGAHQTRFPKTR